MNAVIRIVITLTASLAIAACQSGEKEQPAAAPEPSSAPQQQGAAAPAPPRLRAFAPPSDGKLVPAQVEQYIAVRRRALELARQSAGATATLLQLLPEIPAAETRAAGDLGRDIAEYRWVQERIAEASPPSMPEGMTDALKALETAAAKGGAQLHQAVEKDRSIPAPVPADPAVVAYNRSVLEPFRGELAAIEKDQLRPGA